MALPDDSTLVPGRTRKQVARALGCKVKDVTAIETRALLKIGLGLQQALLSDPDFIAHYPQLRSIDPPKNNQ